MHRHFWLGLRLVAVVLCALVGAAAVSAAGKPNVVVIVTDDASYRDYGFSASLTNGTTLSQTPNIDALAQQSIIGAQYYTAHPLCSPGRAGMLTGQHPMRYGYEYNPYNFGWSAGSQGLKTEQITLAQRLKSLNYTTGVIGKWHVGYQEGLNRPLDKGFDEFFGLLGGARDYYVSNDIDHGMWKNDQFYESQYRLEGDPSRYDPVKGRYVTDAWGEEAADFINRHADDENPFFLYLPFTSPHEPYQAKQSDLDRFAHISDPTRRTVSAMIYALDRAIGDVTNALEANGIDDETIVVFTNDNGGPFWFGSAPFRGHKGTLWEGGIRVPFTIKAPGLTPGVTNQVITGLDIVPTVVAAAGGDITQFQHDGHDVMPYLRGEQTDDSNKVYFWRNFDSYALRKGDWKLTIPYQGSPGPHLFNIRIDPTESVFGLYQAQPAKYAELHRELTNIESQLAKPEWKDLGVNQNLFDHFVFRNNVATTANWSAANNWVQAGTQNNATLRPADAYANAILEFSVRNDANYTATNDMKRMSRETFMLNELKLTGEFNGQAVREGLINGNSVLFVKNLSGQLPRINLTATASGGPEKFMFRVDNELQLLHDLEITGDGTQNFVISGAIRDYYYINEPNVTSPHNVHKTGISSVTLSGNNTFGGTLTVGAGQVAVDGPSAAINGASSITVNDGGTFNLLSGLVKTPSLHVQPGGLFIVEGGLLETNTVSGSLRQNGGTFAPGLTTAISTISEDFIQNGGVLQMQLGGATPGTGFDQLVVGDTVAIAGTVQVTFNPGFTPGLYQTFEILRADNIIGTFSAHDLPALPNGLTWRVLYTTDSVSLTVRPPGGSNTVIPTGDYNLDGVVDAADYSVWRDNVGSTTFLEADGNGDQVVDQLDYEVWKSHFGDSFTGLAGDFNYDGAVDAADYSVWRDGLGSTWTIDDFAVWKTAFLSTNFDAGSGHGGLASSRVPEPSNLIYLLVGELLLECTAVRRYARRLCRSASLA